MTNKIIVTTKQLLVLFLLGRHSGNRFIKFIFSKDTMKTLNLNLSKYLANLIFLLKGNVKKPDHVSYLLGVSLPIGFNDEMGKEIVNWILQGCSKREVLTYVREYYEIMMTKKQLQEVISWALAEKLLQIKDLFDCFPSFIPGFRPELPMPPEIAPTNPSYPTPSTPSLTPHGTPDVAPVKESFVTTISNFVSDHKVAIIVGSIAIVGAGIVIYIIWKRKGPTPPTETSMSVSEKSSESSNKDSSVSKMVFILVNLSFLGLCFFTFIKEFINHAFEYYQ